MKTKYLTKILTLVVLASSILTSNAEKLDISQTETIDS